MLKKVLVLFISCLLILNMSFVYGTEENDDDDRIELYRVEPCPLNCGGGLFDSTEESSWYNSGESQNCSHYPFGLDYRYERRVTVTTTCNKCSYGYSNTSIQSKWVCSGHN